MPPARPILFSAPMIRALLDGRKTQTRRIIKPQPIKINGGWMVSAEKGYANYRYAWGDNEPVNDKFVPEQCPYGRPGDLLWVRERGWIAKSKLAFVPLVMNEQSSAPTSPDGAKYKAIPSIHMPKWASRLTLEITDVRAQCLQDISEEDASAEGASVAGIEFEPGSFMPEWAYKNNQKRAFQHLWQSINGDESWEENPWLWALTFKVHKSNVDALLSQKAA